MKILVAEDSPIFRRMLHHMLSKWGFEVILAKDGSEAWNALHFPDAPRLALLDWMMPGMDGVEICRRLRQDGRETYVYILLLTAKTEQKDLLEGMEAGADDYVTKPFDAHELRVRIMAGQRLLDLQQQLVEAREALREQATRDGLTGFWNRTAIFEIVQKELARSHREGLPLSIVMADIDHFKKINDGFGHIAGDSVLREASSRLRSCSRPYDAIGRYGGEEFLIVLPGCDLASGAGQAERLRETICAEPFALAKTQLLVTCSFGISSTAFAKNTESLIHLADTALYVAKARGRNRVEFPVHQHEPETVAV